MSPMKRGLDDVDICLIENVKRTPALFDPNNEGFRISENKEQEWKNISSTIGLSTNEARRRWTCLRDRYSRELKLTRLHPDDDVYGKNDFFRSMDFLRQFVRKRRRRRFATSSTKAGRDTEWDASSSKTHSPTHFVDSSKDETQTYSEFIDPSKKIEHIEATNILQEEFIQDDDTYNFIDSNKEENNNKTNTNKVQIENSVTEKENEDDYFCKSVAIYLRQLKRRHKIKAKVEIYQILEKYIDAEENEVQIH